VSRQAEYFRELNESSSSGYRRILKASVLIGGSSLISILFGILRTKVLALLIGREGMGLFGAYSSVTALVSAATGFGIQTSGVRQIAQSLERKILSKSLLSGMCCGGLRLPLALSGCC